MNKEQNSRISLALLLHNTVLSEEKVKQKFPCNDERCCGLATILCERILWPFQNS